MTYASKGKSRAEMAEIRLRALEMLKAGVKVADVAAATGCTPSTVSTWKSKAGIDFGDRMAPAVARGNLAAANVEEPKCDRCGLRGAHECLPGRAEEMPGTRDEWGWP